MSPKFFLLFMAAVLLSVVNGTPCENSAEYYIHLQTLRVVDSDVNVYPGGDNSTSNSIHGNPITDFISFTKDRSYMVTLCPIGNIIAIEGQADTVSFFITKKKNDTSEIYFAHTADGNEKMNLTFDLLKEADLLNCGNDEVMAVMSNNDPSKTPSKLQKIGKTNPLILTNITNITPLNSSAYAYSGLVCVSKTGNYRLDHGGTFKSTLYAFTTKYRFDHYEHSSQIGTVSNSGCSISEFSLGDLTCSSGTVVTIAMKNDYGAPINFKRCVTYPEVINITLSSMMLGSFYSFDIITDMFGNRDYTYANNRKNVIIDHNRTIFDDTLSKDNANYIKSMTDKNDFSVEQGPYYTINVTDYIKTDTFQLNVSKSFGSEKPKYPRLDKVLIDNVMDDHAALYSKVDDKSAQKYPVLMSIINLLEDVYSKEDVNPDKGNVVKFAWSRMLQDMIADDPDGKESEIGNNLRMIMRHLEVKGICKESDSSPSCIRHNFTIVDISASLRETTSFEPIQKLEEMVKANNNPFVLLSLDPWNVQHHTTRCAHPIKSALGVRDSDNDYFNFAGVVTGLENTAGVEKPFWKILMPRIGTNNNFIRVELDPEGDDFGRISRKIMYAKYNGIVSK